MFDRLEKAPPDPILGLTVAFREDPRPDKINLGVGIYKDETGETPVMKSVKKAEQRLIEQERTKNYLPIDGEPAYGKAVRQLTFGKGHSLVDSGRAVTMHTPGGTGGLRVATDLLKRFAPKATMWVSDPTWANHNQIFEAVGFPVKTYPYYSATTQSLDFDGMIRTLASAAEGDIVLLHGCCHNPTGLDPSFEQWKKIGEVMQARQLFPFVDFAYQGLARGIEEDAEGVRILSEACSEMVIINSYSKNFGLYRERTGAMIIVGDTKEKADTALSHAKQIARTSYSNPPSHGGAIVTTIVNDEKLHAEWLREVAEIRDRILEMRNLFVETLKAKGVSKDFSFIKSQNGMFSFSGLDKVRVEKLKTVYGVYIVGSGRINVAGMTKDNMDRLCSAIAAVL
jgi:aspartate/tyrosine/aromatic aminotransferase